jgi:hypothetical protein
MYMLKSPLGTITDSTEAKAQFDEPYFKKGEIDDEILNMTLDF